MENKVYNSIAELPNKRGEYVVNAQFADKKEVCRVTIAYDVNEDTDTEIKTAYCFIVDSLDNTQLYSACFGFSTVRNAIAECEARLKGIV